MKTHIFDEKQQQEQQQQNVALFTLNSSHWFVMQHAPNFRDTGEK